MITFAQNATHRSRRHNDVGRESLATARQGRTPAAVRHPRILSPARNRPSRAPAHSAVETRSSPVLRSDRAHVALPPSDLNSAVLPHSIVTASGDGPPGSVKSISSDELSRNAPYVSDPSHSNYSSTIHLESVEHMSSVTQTEKLKLLGEPITPLLDIILLDLI
jgi:hypothetical protein